MIVNLKNIKKTLRHSDSSAAGVRMTYQTDSFRQSFLRMLRIIPRIS
jgi:hypothetical protein